MGMKMLFRQTEPNKRLRQNSSYDPGPDQIVGIIQNCNQCTRYLDVESCLGAKAMSQTPLEIDGVLGGVIE